MFDCLQSGCYWYADGSMYDGQWAHGKMHGKGVFIYPNGNRWVTEEDRQAHIVQQKTPIIVD